VNSTGRKPIKESDRQIDTVAKALCLLDCFTVTNPELPLKRLSEMTGLYKSRIIRLCGTLAANGYLIRTPVATYKLGPKLMILGKVYERTNPLTAVARPIMKDLSALTGESTKLFVIEGTKRLCLVRERGPSPLQYAINEGETQELYAGAGGKLLLAFAPEAFQKEIIRRSRKKFTDETITDADALQKELETIRRQGYAASQGELVSEVAGLAAPVYDCESLVCAALTIAGPKQRFGAERRKQMLAQLLDAAQQLSLLLGNRASA
jgi:DNA-binding IclR family transcriptional regulator